jgi:hypothetical protein
VALYVKKPIPVDAHQWWTNGDHPDDLVGQQVPDPARRGETYTRMEGAVVRFFRRPGWPGTDLHDRCSRTWHEHGWIDTLEGGHTVCPGDWILTGVEGEHWPVKASIFKATYDPAPRAPLPWDDPNADPLADVRVWVERRINE